MPPCMSRLDHPAFGIAGQNERCRSKVQNKSVMQACDVAAAAKNPVVLTWRLPVCSTNMSHLHAHMT
eukprot:1139474-Pelagomonas_calceolata.AAC.1